MVAAGESSDQSRGSRAEMRHYEEWIVDVVARGESSVESPESRVGGDGAVAGGW